MGTVAESEAAEHAQAVRLETAQASGGIAASRGTPGSEGNKAPNPLDHPPTPDT